jgi:Arc/MetJ-type ribon-helix-helix transcriptional regulator
MSETMYRTIRLPKDLIDKVEKQVQKPGMGYKSIAEFVKDAIREKLTEGVSS